VKHDDGLNQAISYACAVSISAEYAVYTNGTAWRVKRFVDGEWIGVPDIPVTGPARPLGSVDDLLRTVALVSPLLHKLDEPLSGKDARLYLEALQGFFGSQNLVTASADHDLRAAADNLLRVLFTGPEEAHYSQSKLSNTARRAEVFRSKTGVGDTLPELQAGESVFTFMSELSASMHPLLDGGRDIGGVNQKLIRLILSLLEYGRLQTDGAYPPFPAHLHAAIREFLTTAMALSMDVHIPDAIEAEFTSDMKHYCRSGWEEVVRNDLKEEKDERRDAIGAVWSTLAFWRKRRQSR
jgi:hypothetical protein